MDKTFICFIRVSCTGIAGSDGFAQISTYKVGDVYLYCVGIAIIYPWWPLIVLLCILIVFISRAVEPSEVKWD